MSVAVAFVPTIIRYTYLGIIFTATQGAKSGGEALLGAARHAMFAFGLTT